MAHDKRIKVALPSIEHLRVSKRSLNPEDGSLLASMCAVRALATDGRGRAVMSASGPFAVIPARMLSKGRIVALRLRTRNREVGDVALRLPSG